MNPPVASEVVARDGVGYLQSNEAMFTFYKRTKGEFSKYFLGLRDELKIYGARCPGCGVVRVPPFELFCPECDFTELEPVPMPDTGVMMNTPPVTYFAHSLFQSWVPFGRGRVLLEGADTAVPMHVYTTKGVLTPFVFRRGTPVKVVFRDRRIGKPTDVFAVPQSELTAAQLAKSPLLESELDFTRPAEPAVPPATPDAKAKLARALKMLQKLAKDARRSPRARHNLAGWKRRIAIKTPGGALAMVIDDGTLDVSPGPLKGPTDLVLLFQDPQTLLDWLTFREALTNAIIAGKLWISVNREFTTIFKLDRLPRSVLRDGT
ncbi:MAG: hypothetical protein HY907_04475 [Deltaproteobacteria bacterium]|nr:hypothetical protein [Deltaproteobacteria bacterium]